jgi:hypothetical protein
MKQIGLRPVGDLVAIDDRRDVKGGDRREWPENLRVFELPVARVGGAQ